MKYQMIAAIFAVFLSAAAHADWKDSYRGYADAIESGDEAAALAFARKAWLEAKEALPPSENRALLAQNYAGLAVIAEPEASLAPLDDALALAEAGFGLHGHELAALRFMKSEVEAALDRRDRAKTRAAVDAYLEVSIEGAVASPLIAQAFRLGQNLNIEERNADLADLGSRVSDVLFSLEGVPPDILLSAEVLRAVGILGDKPVIARLRQYRASRALNDRRFVTYVDRMELSWRRFNAIIGMFEPVETIEEVDTVASQAMAWRSLINAFQYSFEAARSAREGRSEYHRLTAWDPSCANAYRWQKRPVNFPREAYGSNGAVLVGFHLNRRGLVVQPRVITEIPREQFSPSVLRDLDNWVAEVDPAASEQCLRDLIVPLQFATPVF
ncbi:hypothetical protein HK107_01285 [Parvularcula sp. ZS-1/3]|uniref:TonB C-terminal domain-containing protein n=1 Tax=Parvularcula mediterranea TaxID=2732508 RepID=A0A7Y3RJS6_9PROT|nr:hypothetical protein [Parvularcula mediterranea]NNU14955.1 hypothetical protein [Parvularcula mediterranea]